MKMNNFSKIVALSFLLFAGGKSLNAQITHQKIGDNPTMISPTAVLDIESTNKGILMPRVNLTGTLDQAPIPTATGVPANGLTVFNLNTAGDVTPGYYYWSTPLARWVRVADQTSVTEPWRVQGDTIDATLNSQNIYQIGRVSIGGDIPSAQLAVIGDMFQTTQNSYPLGVGELIKNSSILSGQNNLNGNDGVFLTSGNNFNYTARVEVGDNGTGQPGTYMAVDNYVDNTGLAGLGVKYFDETSFGANDGRFSAFVSSVTSDKSSNSTWVEDLVSTTVENASESNTFNIGTSLISSSVYPSTRNDLSVFSPSNFLYTDNFGNFLSAPVSEINKNIYNSNGTVTAGANRNVFIPDATNLNFSGSDGGSVYSFVESGTIGMFAYNDDGRIEMATDGNSSDISLETRGAGSDILLQPNNTGNRFVGIGTQVPTEKLDIGAGNVRVRDINTTIGAATDRIVVADATGVLKSVTAASLVTANNGLTKHATTGAIQLGGDLNRATNIATTISGTTYPFSITGLPVGNTSDYVMLNGFGTGDLKIITKNDLVQEPWNVIGSPAGTQATSNTESIYQMGNVAIGATTIPTITAGATTINPKFHVAGDISTTGKLWTTNSVYADYVFDYYFDGFSKIYEEYKFKSLKEVAEFIRENKHLPGVTPISEIVTNEAGYTIDLTQLSMQQLEKLEELYLHVIEMNDTMMQKDQEIKALQNKTKELEERLMKLERLIEKN